jgi:hypothetical protein
MIRRRQRDSEPGHASGFGIGVQVHVLEDPEGRPEMWRGEPTGLIIAKGSDVVNGGINVPKRLGRAWLVAFDSPQYRADGRGPFERAEIVEALLAIAPGVDER